MRKLEEIGKSIEEAFKQGGLDNAIKYCTSMDFKEFVVYFNQFISEPFRRDDYVNIPNPASGTEAFVKSKLTEKFMEGKK